jgi:hypothetical protein
VRREHGAGGGLDERGHALVRGGHGEAGMQKGRTKSDSRERGRERDGKGDDGLALCLLVPLA